jgi:uncharacterized membrane protein
MDKPTGRAETFSDGVFAIAITLLILEIRVPELEGAPGWRELAAALVRLWPSLFAFLFSFFVILVMWINHHEFMRWVKECDYRFLFANGLLLMWVTFVPFPTAVVARYLGTDAGRAAAAFYCGTFMCISLSYQVLLQSVVRGRRLIHDHIPDETLDRVRRAYLLGPIVYGISTLIAFWSAWAGLLLCASLWVLWTRLCYHPYAERRAAAPPAHLPLPPPGSKTQP